jgi:hypothetical protein
MKLPMNIVVTKELQIRGTFRFDEEFALAVDLMGKGLIDVKPLLTETLSFERAPEAFELASDRSRARRCSWHSSVGSPRDGSHLLSQHLLPRSSVQRSPALAVGCIPVTSTGMTTGTER